MALEVVPGADRPVAPRYGVRVNWGAIFCGALITLGFGVVFLLLGNAIGLSPINAVSPAAGGALKFFSWIYTAITMIAAFFIGGYATVHVGGIEMPMAGVMHSLTSWALAGVFAVSYGLGVSLIFRSTVLGVGPNAANWLLLCISVLGAVAAAAGARSARAAMRLPEISKEKDRYRAAS